MSVVVKVKTRRQPGGIPSIIKAVRSNSAVASANFALGTAAGAKRRVHVITGNLKNSIVAVPIHPRHWEVVVGAHYGIYEEYGTRHRPPHPYLRPSVEDQKRAFQRDLKRLFIPGGVVHR